LVRREKEAPYLYISDVLGGQKEAVIENLLREEPAEAAMVTVTKRRDKHQGLMKVSHGHLACPVVSGLTSVYQDLVGVSKNIYSRPEERTGSPK